MRKVFDEAVIAGIALNNRVLRSATHEGMSDKTGKPTEQLVSRYVALAKGGVGAIITGYIGIQKNGKAPLSNMLMLDTDDNIEPLGDLVKAVHTYRTPIIAQLAHCGRQTRSKSTGYKPVAPSAIRDKVYNEETPHELNEREIIEIIHNFVLAIERSKKAGFDGVQLHCAHGYLLSSFLSPHMNKRTDKWGGTTENRFRIVKEIFIEARKKIGEYPILAKINAYEKSKDGIKLPEAIKIAKYLESVGCDAIEVSAGTVEDGFVTVRGNVPVDIMLRDNFRLQKILTCFHPIVKPIIKKVFAGPKPYELYNLDSAVEIKKNVKTPVIVVGGITKLEDIQNIIEKEMCDFVSMSRALILEPDLVNKFKEGRKTQAKCINCNYCLIGGEERSLKCYYGRISEVWQ
ncbi:MAG: NADH:flavin oxidoreductase [Firmicutes bacterium]|nr:NADH:flavin oxidoreductase [Bacillota bacterium]